MIDRLPVRFLCLRFGVVEIQEPASGKGKRYWRWAGLQTHRWFVARSRFDALLQASHSCREAMAKVEFYPLFQVEKRGVR